MDTVQYGRTDLDSHANMFVAGRAVHVLAESGRTINVNAFTPDLPQIELPIVDCAFIYDSPTSGERILCVAQDAIYAPNMDHNLVPPFMLREAGVEVSTTPKCQTKEPDESTHSLYWPKQEIRIPLSLHGIFSYFSTRKPTILELEDESLQVIKLTPDGVWEPNTDVHATNEDNLVDWEGKVIDRSMRPKKILLEDIQTISYCINHCQPS